ncbi:hypothetical protein TYRP_022202 [Tyrophagus putrescentiae]|nr:hypothetical protein TYRP_022202 [Tyrophagus putrescentiae]
MTRPVLATRLAAATTAAGAAVPTDFFRIIPRHLSWCTTGGSKRTVIITFLVFLLITTWGTSLWAAWSLVKEVTCFAISSSPEGEEDGDKLQVEQLWKVVLFYSSILSFCVPAAVLALFCALKLTRKQQSILGGGGGAGVYVIDFGKSSHHRGCRCQLQLLRPNDIEKV